jgi:cysteine desulfurase
MSGHKIYGPNGVGILYTRNRPDLTLEPIMTGGSQERGVRPGTVPVPLVVGMGEACAIANAQLEDDAERMADLGQRLLEELTEEFPQLLTFGTMEARIPGNLSIGVPGIPGELLVETVSREVAISTGAACSTGSPEPSHVLVALGNEPELAATGVRISLGRFTTDEEICAASRSIHRAIKTLTGGT